MRRRRQQNGGVFLHKQRGIWYYRRSVNGKRKLTPIGKLSEYPTKAKAVRASQAFVADGPKQPGITFEGAALRYMAERMPTHPPTAGAYCNYLETLLSKLAEDSVRQSQRYSGWLALGGLRGGQVSRSKCRRRFDAV